jgi:predicted transcriptional regulator
MSRRDSPIAPVVQEAVAMIAGQLGCTEAEALNRLQARAEVGQYRLHNYARLVLDRIIRFDEPPPSA